jgi:uracil-DNA glycosylase
MSRELSDHLQYFAEIGVAGVSRDPKWRTRAAQSVPGTNRDSAAQSQSVPGTNRDSLESLSDIQTDIGVDCRRCKLCSLGRTQIVFGKGHPKARLMFVGEAPGQEEDERGEPFVGKSGQLLTKIIEAIGLSREQVYIANVIKCRPPSNRNPEPDEVASCEPYLFRQIDVIQPKVIVPLGKFAAQSLLKTMDPITKLRGRQFDYRGAVLIPTFHPAYLLRNPSAKREVWDDMKKVREILQAD